MLFTAEVECPVPTGFEVDQVRGIFDLKRQDIARESFEVEIPDLDSEWQIGAIVGPSGSGKTTVARYAFGKDFIESIKWNAKQAVVSQFGKMSIKDITRTLSSVGFSSPPSWIKPHHVLSGGERFRCDLARALLRPGPLVAFDEFTSVVDRSVAKIGSMAIAKSIRNGTIAKRFVAVTCHYDILEWLQPDWVLDMASRQLARGCLYQRPAIDIEIAPVHHSAWALFRRHHYLSHYHSPAAKCFCAFWNGEPVAFSSWFLMLTGDNARDVMREHRTVVLPDFQGVGIGNRLSESVAGFWRRTGWRAFSTTSHPSMIHYRHNSAKWRTRHFGFAAKPGAQYQRAKSCAADRVTGSFEFVGVAMDAELAARWAEGLKHVHAETSEAAAILACVSSVARSVRSIAKRTALPAEVVSKFVNKLIEGGELSSVQTSAQRRAYVANRAGEVRNDSPVQAGRVPRRKK